ncbi:hypothetical protein HK098_005575 [Nowakowskiella sp. JEL0407]|nr:hypothetical protein HK098_005575 [Nowakowskiella sp. JEL0407]
MDFDGKIVILLVRKPLRGSQTIFCTVAVYITGLIIGLVLRNVVITYLGLVIGVVISALAIIPPWPYLNQNPVKWLPKIPETKAEEKNDWFSFLKKLL